jgi:hypothetical protein
VPDYWRSSGYRLLAPGSDGNLHLTDDFLRSFLVRPELAPVPQSCAAELELSDALMADPRRDIGPDTLDAIADPDARENYRIWVRFRDRLVAADSLEAAYVSVFHGEGVDVPPLFVAQLTQVILRHILGEKADPLAVRAAEMLFRTQKIAVTDDGAVMAADEVTIEMYAEGGGFGSLGELLSRNRTPPRTVDLDVLDVENGASYWERDERHDFSVSLNRGRAALTALTRVMEDWIAHFLAVKVAIRTEREIDDAHWMWHVGLDAEASGMLNDLYNRQSVDEARMQRLLCLFRLDFDNPADMRPALAGRPVWLAMAMDERNRLRLKPQNLLMNLPLARLQ